MQVITAIVLASGLLASGTALTASTCRGHASTGHFPLDKPAVSPPTASHRSNVLEIARDEKFRLVLVSVRINGNPARLILDTGSSNTFVSPEASGLTVMNLKLGETPTKGTGFISTRAYWGKVTLETGARIWTDHKVLIEDMKNISDTLGQKIDGILGADILNEFQCVEIDFKHQRLVLGSE